MQERGDYSEATSEAIDNEIKDIISAQYKVAIGILKNRKNVLIRGAKLLLEKEKIDHDEIETLMQQTTEESPEA
jgi:cell division protease FtsH